MSKSNSGCFALLCAFGCGVVVGFIAAIVAQWCGIVVWTMGQQGG